MTSRAAEDVRTPVPPPPRPAPRARRGVGRLRPVLLVLAALVGWAGTARLVALWDVSVVEEEWRDRLVPVLTVLGGLAGVAVALVARRRPRALRTPVPSSPAC